LIELLKKANTEKFKVNLSSCIAVSVEDNVKLQEASKEIIPILLKNIFEMKDSISILNSSIRCLGNLVNKSGKLQDFVRENSQDEKENIYKLICELFDKNGLAYLKSDDIDKVNLILYSLVFIQNMTTKNNQNMVAFVKYDVIGGVTIVKSGPNKQVSKIAGNILPLLTSARTSSFSKSSSDMKKTNSDDGKQEKDEKNNGKKSEKKEKKREKKEG